jgi:nitrogen fixation NifU-like protein
MASASMMADALRGKSVEEVKALFERFHELVTSDPSQAAEGLDASSELGKLAVFSGVCEFPIRVKCASLPWHTMKAALEGEAKASTE